MNSPEAQGMIQMIQQNPEMLQGVLAQLAQTNPQLVQALQQNPQMLMQLLAGGLGGADGAGMRTVLLVRFLDLFTPSTHCAPPVPMVYRYVHTAYYQISILRALEAGKHAASPASYHVSRPTTAGAQTFHENRNSLAKKAGQLWAHDSMRSYSTSSA